MNPKKLLFYSLTPILACSLLSGIGFAASVPAGAQSTTSGQAAPMTAAQKRAAKKEAKKEAKAAKTTEATKSSAATTAPAETAKSKRAAKKEAKAAKQAQAAKTAETPAKSAETPAPMTRSEPAKTESAKTVRKTSPSTATTVSAGDIANAKAKGMVWVNTDSKIYHTDGKYYGNTKQGKFMSVADAQKAGYKAAKR